MSKHYFSWSGELDAVSIKSASRHLMPNLYFCIRWDLRVNIVYSGASRPRNVNALFFMLGWDWYRFYKKHIRTRYVEVVFLDLVGYAAHVAHSCASGARNVNALFSWSGRPGAVSIKSLQGNVTPNLCFCIRWDLLVMYCIPVCPGYEPLMLYFS
jgi:hypothetical protein